MPEDLVDLRYRLSRRRFVQAGIGAGVLGTLGRLSRAAAAQGRPAARPNVLLIIGDDQGWTDFGFMDHPVIRTPNLDGLAAGGILLPEAYVAAPLCRPSLASILTGLYPHQNRICCNDPPPVKGKTRDEADYSFMKDLPTLPRLLAPLGYRSLQTGKYWEHHYKSGGFTDGMTTKGRHGGPGLVIGRKTMDPIYRFVDDCQAKGDPFFLWYAPFMPHTPHNPPKRLLEKYAVDGRPERVAKYYAMCEWFDETCGDLLGYLDKRGLRENTLVAFLVDNGWTEGYLAEKTGGKGQAKGKQSPYDGGVRTPFVLNWPGRIRPGTSADLAVAVDLAPTILTACGAKPTGQMQGINLLDADARADRKAVFGEAFVHTARDTTRPGPNLRARWVREGPWKLIVPAKTDSELSGEPELYNLAEDPFERTNLAADHAERVQRLRRQLDAWWTPR